MGPRGQVAARDAGTVAFLGLAAAKQEGVHCYFPFIISPSFYKRSLNMYYGAQQTGPALMRSELTERE